MPTPWDLNDAAYSDRRPNLANNFSPLSAVIERNQWCDGSTHWYNNTWWFVDVDTSTGIAYLWAYRGNQHGK